MSLINYFIAFFLFIIGVIIKFAKQYWLISGYNTSSKEKKQNYDIKRFAKLFYNVFSIVAIVIILGTFISQIFEIRWLEHIIIIVSVIPSCVYLVIVGNSKKYYK